MSSYVKVVTKVTHLQDTVPINRIPLSGQGPNTVGRGQRSVVCNLLAAGCKSCVPLRLPYPSDCYFFSLSSHTRHR